MKFYVKAPCLTTMLGGLMLSPLPALAEDLVIGLATAQTGGLAPYDQPSLRGLEMAVEEINAGGGAAGKFPIKLIIRDTRSDAAQTALVAQELVDEGVKIMITPCDADPSIAAGQVTQAAQIPAFSFCATTPTLPLAVGDFMFGNYPADNAQAAVLAGYAAERGYRKAYILKSPDSAYTLKLPEYFAAAFKGAGGEVVGEEHLMLGGAMHKGRGDIAEVREDMLQRFPILKERLDQKAGSLSGGEQQMLAIARAMMSSPDLLLLDEPSLGLAPQVVDLIFDLIVGLRQRGLTILLVEQNVQLSLEIADAGYVMANGRIVLAGTAAELRGSTEIQGAYLGG